MIGYQCDLEENGSNRVALGNSVTVNDDNTTVIGNTDIILDADGDITLDADGGEVYLKDGGNTFATFTTASSRPALILYEDISGGTSDYFRILTTASGETTMSTVDGGGIAGHFNLDVDGDIRLNSLTGSFSLQNNGTQFSVADSAYAGMILGYTTVGIDAADDSYTLTTSMRVTDSAHKVKFVAPPSGVVEIFVSIYADTSRRAIVFGLSDHNITYSAIDFPSADDITNEHKVYIPGGSIDDLQLNHYWVVTGLTPGTQYEWTLGAQVQLSTGGVLRWGGDISGEYQPFIMKATALPAAVTDFAVYG